MALYELSSENELYSYAPFIPLFSAYLLYSNRKKVFAQTGFSASGLTLIIASGFLYAGARSSALGEGGLLTLMAVSWAVFLSGGFMMAYGTRAARAGAFPLAFLLFMAPLPQSAIDALTRFLQSWSAETAWWLFNLVGAPVNRDGYFFHLPGLTVEVAKQCSGIRSSMALFISGVLASHLFLKTWPARGALLAAVVPIAVLKNGLRITALTLSGYYVDERMLYGSLHTRGGMLFFGVAIAIAGCAVWGLRALERKSAKKNAAGA